ncbi:MAG TPA: hypothetical protein VHO70_12130, partial [Chitinispirillaceae bacterium]|nr:hypothetical protein [Chitinispirillaceae bacterium]
LILTKAARRELVCSIRSMFYGKVIKIRAIDFKYRLDICLNRRLAEPRGVSKDHWERVITQMMEAFESMIDNELFDEVLFVDSLTIPTKVPNQAITSE